MAITMWCDELGNGDLCGGQFMESLKDFIASHAEKLRNEESQAAHKRSEWVAAVGRLNQQIMAWLTSADPDHAILEVRETPYQLREEGIGSYVARGLLISCRDAESSAWSRSREMWRVHFRQLVSSTSVERTGEWI